MVTFSPFSFKYTPAKSRTAWSQVEELLTLITESLSLACAPGKSFVGCVASSFLPLGGVIVRTDAAELTGPRREVGSSKAFAEAVAALRGVKRGEVDLGTEAPAPTRDARLPADPGAGAGLGLTDFRGPVAALQEVRCGDGTLLRRLEDLLREVLCDGKGPSSSRSKAAMFV